MPTYSDLEERLKQELRRKILIVESSPTRPSEALIQQRIRSLGDKCYEARTIIQQARYEYANLMHDKRDLFAKRGGAFHFLVKIKQLEVTHQQQKAELVSATECFVLAHEWYEILVTVDEVSELSRLEFLSRLSEETVFEPTEPGDRGYPEPAATQRSYARKDVTEMVKYQLRQFAALLQEEREVIEQAEVDARRIASLEEAAMHEMRMGYLDLQDEIRRRNEDDDERMLQMENTYKAIMDQCDRNAECFKDILRQLKEDAEGRKEIMDQIRRCAGSYKKFKTELTNDLEEMREWIAKKIDYSMNGRRSEASQHEKDARERLLEECEKELQDIMHFLNTYIGRERRFSNRVMNKEKGEGLLTCSYCKEAGKHYSDACPNVRLVSERIKMLLAEGRCLICVELHVGRPCGKVYPCFYCKPNGPQPKITHHSSICTRPEEYTNKIKRRYELQMVIDCCRKSSAEPEKQRSPSSTKARRTHATHGSSRRDRTTGTRRRSSDRSLSDMDCQPGPSRRDY